MGKHDEARVLVMGPRNFEEAEFAQRAFCEAATVLVKASSFTDIGMADLRVRQWLRWMPIVRLHYGLEIERRHRELETQTIAQVAALGLTWKPGGIE